MPSELEQHLNMLPFPAALGDPAHRFVHVNPAFSGIYGWTREEIIGLPGAVLLPRNFSGVQLKRILKEISHAQGGWSDVVTHNARDGSPIRMHCRTFPVKPRPSHRPVLYLGIFAPEGKLAAVETELVAVLSGAVLNHASLSSTNRLLRRRLTRAEEVCRLAALGYSRKEISAMMGIAVSTVGVVLFRSKRRDGGR